METPGLPAGYLPLRDVVVTVRPGGVNVRAEADKSSQQVGELRENARQRAVGLLWRDYSWLHIPVGQRGDRMGWVAGEFTDFSRSAAYNQVSDAWYESEAVLAFRRGLVRDLLRARGSDDLDQVATLTGSALTKLEDTLTRQTMPPGVVQFRQIQERLGLPAPFEYLPVHSAPPAGIHEMEFLGFGPNTFAFQNWELYYHDTRGMHNGVDFITPEGSPLIAVADGVIAAFRFLGNDAERSLALRPYLPETVRKADGTRVLSNVLVAYGHLTGDPTAQLVRVGDEVKAGEIIGTSGWPVFTRDDGTVGVQRNNAHLHLEVHLVTDGQRNLGSRYPFNPLLFWSPRLVAWQARLAGNRGEPPYPQSGQPYGRLGFFSVGAFAYDPPAPRVWEYVPNRQALWPQGVYDLDNLISWVGRFAPYPTDGTSLF